jgi:hypothetical protein
VDAVTARLVPAAVAVAVGSTVLAGVAVPASAEEDPSDRVDPPSSARVGVTAGTLQPPRRVWVTAGSLRWRTSGLVVRLSWDVPVDERGVRPDRYLVQRQVDGGGGAAGDWQDVALVARCTPRGRCTAIDRDPLGRGAETGTAQGVVSGTEGVFRYRVVSRLGRFWRSRVPSRERQLVSLVPAAVTVTRPRPDPNATAPTPAGTSTAEAEGTFPGERTAVSLWAARLHDGDGLTVSVPWSEQGSRVGIARCVAPHLGVTVAVPATSGSAVRSVVTVRVVHRAAATAAAGRISLLASVDGAAWHLPARMTEAGFSRSGGTVAQVATTARFTHLAGDRGAGHLLHLCLTAEGSGGPGVLGESATSSESGTAGAGGERHGGAEIDLLQVFVAR